MKHLKPLSEIEEDITKIKIFAAGSIEMGKAELWQDRLAKELSDFDVVLYNPRRDDWDSSWVQDPTPGTQFHDQVSWELERIDHSDIVFFYFDPNTTSPITLLELGLVLNSETGVVVCCPDGYFRKGNVVVTCDFVGVKVVNTFEEAVENLKQMIRVYNVVDNFVDSVYDH